MRMRTLLAASALAATAVLGGTVPAMADSGATGVAEDSPGILSGNVLQVPVDIPVNLCGNSVDILSLLNPSAGNVCVNG